MSQFISCSGPERDDEGNYIVGDMILTSEQYANAYTNKVLLSGVKDPTKRWTGGEGVKAGISDFIWILSQTTSAF